jgi:hypothetical protein
MAVTYTLRFTPDISSAELQRFARRLGEWMAQRSELCADLPGADDHATRDLSAGEQPQLPPGRPSGGHPTLAIPIESISIGPGLFGPERALEIVLHPVLFFDLMTRERQELLLPIPPA